MIDVVGKEQEDAEDMLEEEGFTNVKVELESSETLKAGLVIRASVEKDEEVDSESEIIIYVSTGSSKIAVPSVIGMTEAVAKSTLEGAGFKVTVENSEDSSKSDGVVLRQSNSDKANEGDTITITVNKLPEDHTVTISVNAAPYLTKSSGSSSSDDETGDNTSSGESVKVEIYVGNDRITDADTIATKNSPVVTATWTTSGRKEIKVVVNGTTLPTKTINFSDGDQSVSF